jgi:hypothetical protein
MFSEEKNDAMALSKMALHIMTFTVMRLNATLSRSLRRVVATRNSQFQKHIMQLYLQIL